MADKNKKIILFFFFTGIILCVLIIFSTSYNKLFHNFINITFASFLKIPSQTLNSLNTSLNLKSKKTLIEENSRLISQIQELETKLNNYDFIISENQKLKKLLDFKEKSLTKFSTITARVSGFSAGNWFNTILIDRGYLDNVKIGNAVINEEGVIGRVIKTNKDSSLVLLITDPESSVAVEVLRNSLQAVVSGQLGQPLILKYVLNSADIVTGDEIVTSSRSVYFPPGLKVGHVIKIIKNERELFALVLVAPAVDFSKLNKVFVILK